MHVRFECPGVAPELSFPGDRVEDPFELARGGVRANVSRRAGIPFGDPRGHDQVVLEHRARRGHFDVRQLGPDGQIPLEVDELAAGLSEGFDQHTGLGVDGIDTIADEGENPLVPAVLILPVRHAPVAAAEDPAAVVRCRIESPDFLARGRVQRNHVDARCREIEQAVHDNRVAVDARAFRKAVVYCQATFRRWTFVVLIWEIDEYWVAPLSPR